MVRAAILQIEKDKGIEVDDNKIIEILAKEVQGKKDALVEFEKGGGDDVIELTNKEIEVLEKYLPKQLSKDEITEIVKDVIASLGATSMKDMGKIMSVIRPKVKGRADGKLINELVKANLQ